MIVMRSLLNAFARLFSGFKGKNKEEESIYEPGESESLFEELHSVWDYLRFNENTQAFHLNGVLGFEEWVVMEEIKRRIKELYVVEYKNDRSLYPYIKTLVDCGLLEALSIGGRRKWRKRDLIISVEKKQKKKQTLVEKKAGKEKPRAEKKVVYT